MADPTLDIVPSIDRRFVKLTFATELDAVVMNVSPMELDTMIRGLAAARVALLPPIPTTHVNAPIQMPVQAQAVVPAERVSDKRLILFRHPGFGWLSFELTGNSGVNLAEGILSAIRTDKVDRDF